MKINDIIYDNDAYIKGKIIDKCGEEFIVLWDNGVVGRVLEDYTEIEVVGHEEYNK